MLCQCVCTPVRLCFMISAAVCQWVCEIKRMCVPVRGPGAGRALLGSWLPRRRCGHVPFHPTHPFCPFLDGRAAQALGRVSNPNPSLLPATWLPGAAKSPPAGPGRRAAAGSQTDTSSPTAPLGAGPVAAPPLAGRGPPGGGPLPAPPSSRSGPPRAVIG